MSERYFGGSKRLATLLAVGLLAIGAVLIFAYVSTRTVHAATPASCFDHSGGHIHQYYEREWGGLTGKPCPKDVVIPGSIGGQPITGIQRHSWSWQGAFEDMGLNSVVIPESITHIEEGAFRRNNLTSAHLGGGVVVIGDEAFYDNQITSVNLPDNLASIGSSAFANNKLTSVTIPNSTVSLGSSAFDHNKITQLVLGSGLNTIASYAFADNELRSLVVPDNIHSIEYSAFADNLFNIIDLGNGVEYLDSSAFYGSFPSSVTYKGITYAASDPLDSSFCFKMDGSLIVSYNYANFESLVAEERICLQEDIVIPDSIDDIVVLGIGYGAFEDRGIKSVTIPDGIEYIGYNSFVNNPFSSVTYRGTTHTASDPLDPSFCYQMSEEGTSITSYTYADFKRLLTEGKICLQREIVIPSSIGGKLVTGIGPHSFADRMLNSVVIPDEVVMIGWEAFAGNCLTSLSLGQGLRTIGEGAFVGRSGGGGVANRVPGIMTDEAPGLGGACKGGNKLSSIDLPDGLVEIGGLAFSENELVSITIPDTVTDVGGGAFSHNKLSDVSLGRGLAVVGEEAFAHNQITEIVIPDTVKSIEQQAFHDNQLTSLRVEEGLERIGYDSFSQNLLTEVTIPDTVTEIGYYAFSQNPIKILHIGSGVTYLPWEDVFDIHHLESLHIGGGIREINSYQFNDLGIKDLYIGQGVAHIGHGAFKGNQLTSLAIPDSVTSIGEEAFAGNQLNSVTYKSTTYTQDDPYVPSACLGVAGSIVEYYNYANFQDLLINERLCLQTDIIIPDGVTGIGDYAFSGNNLTSVTIPDSVTTIGANAFYNNNLTSATIPDSVTTIGANAFSNNNLTSVTIPDSVTLIGHNAFYANQLNTINLGSGIASLSGEEGFATQMTYEVDDRGLPLIETLQFIISKIYTSDPSNPHNIKDLLACGDYWDLGDVRCTGYLINPAQATISYRDSSDNNLQAMTLMGRLPDGAAITSYDENVITGLALNHGFTPEQISSLFYRIGDTIELPELPTIAGYQAPPASARATTLSLAAASTPMIYSYLTSEELDQGYSWNSEGLVVASDGSDLPQDPQQPDGDSGGGASGGLLADTGVSQWLVLGGGVVGVIIGGAVILRRKR